MTFTDATAKAGLEMITPQSSAAWGDYDKDGYQDLLVVNHFNTPNMYRNNGNGTFTDMQPENIGIKSGSGDWHGSAWGDYNNDGHIDLYVVTGTAIIDGSDFYINNGDGTFTDNAANSGVTNENGRGRVPHWIDYDHDGLLDIFVANDKSTLATNKLYKNMGHGTFKDVAASLGLALPYGARGAAWADYDNDGDSDLLLVFTTAKGRGFSLLRNDGNTFTDVTSRSKLPEKLFPRTGAWGDFDNDGDLDLFLGFSNQVYKDSFFSNFNSITAIVRTKNEAEGLTFDATSNASVTFDLWRSDRILYPKQIILGNGNHPSEVPFKLTPDSTEHIGQPDYIPGAGDPRVYIWRNSYTAPWNIRWSGAGVFRTFGIIKTNGWLTKVIPVDLDIPEIDNKRHNLLYINNGDGTFSEDKNFIDEYAYNTYNVQWIDFDNDGDLDLYVTNFGDTQSGNQPNQLYQNNGGSFNDIAKEVGLFNSANGNDSCAAWADYDNNGFLDMYLVNSSYAGYLAGPHKLFRNEGNDNNWLKVNLIGTKSNRLGIGAKIEVKAGTKSQFREIQGSSTNGCNSSLVAHFGMENNSHAETIKVTWPSGIIDILSKVPANRIITIQEDSTK